MRVKLRNRIAALSVGLSALGDFKGVYIAPDRSPEERARQRELTVDILRLDVPLPVEDVRRRRAHQGDDYHRRHYIINGEVVSVDRLYAEMDKDGLERPK